MNMSTIDGKDVKVSRYSPDALRWNAIELMQVFGANPTMRDGKNHADIAIALDAFETVLKHEHIKTVIIVSNDSDFAPLATKLHAYGCYTVGVGTHRAARFLPTSYQEFLWLEDLLDKPEPGSAHPTLQQSCATPSEKDEAGADLRMQSRRALRQAMAVLTPSKAPWMMSQLKAAIQVACPLFDHQKLGFAKFSEWLADQSDLVTLTRVGTELQNRVMPR